MPEPAQPRPDDPGQPGTDDAIRASITEALAPAEVLAALDPKDTP